MYTFLAGRFPIWYFLSVPLSESRCIFVLEPSSSSYYFSMLFIHSAFSLCSFFLHILFQNSFASFASVCWYILVHSLPTCSWNFLLLFWNVLFYLYSLTLSRYVLSLPYFTRIFWFISLTCIVRGFLFVCLFVCLFDLFFSFCMFPFL